MTPCLASPLKSNMTTAAQLSDEFLCEIFQLLCDEPIYLNVLDNTSLFDKFPWAVGLVCKRWRAVFLSNPRLWTSFDLGDGTYSDSYIAEMNRRTAMYVERSSQLPLTIAIAAHHPGMQSTWRILLSLSHRWKAANLELHAPILDDIRKCKGKLPILESLEVWNLASLHIDTFESAPRLVQANLLGWLDRFELLPLSQLTKVTMSTGLASRADALRMHSILPALGNVEELWLTSVSLDTVIPKCSPVRLTRLRILDISRPVVLSWIDAPSLEHLHVEAHSRDRHLYREQISSLVQRSSCHIRQLTLEGCDIRTATTIMDILTDVKKLSIVGSSVDDSCSLFMDIAISIDLPVLEVLEMTVQPKDAAVKVVNSISHSLKSCRWSGKSRTIPLERVMVQLEWEDEEENFFVDIMGESWPTWPSFVATEVVRSGLGFPQSTIINISFVQTPEAEVYCPKCGRSAQ